MNVEALKEKARRHEQREEWPKALELYREAIKKHDADEQPDITLYNRVGDIMTRVGQLDGAVQHYEKAVDLYLEAELPNNAIAVCKKVLRNLPDRHVFFRRMGQIRAAQGFLTDARQSFLTYAERMTAVGDISGALDALIELVELAPDDLEIRLALAGQLETHDRKDEAVEQFAEAYRRLVLHARDADARDVARKLEELSPGIMLPDPQSIRAGAAVLEGAGEVQVGLPGLPGVAPAPAVPQDASGEIEAEFGEIVISGAPEEAAEEVPLEEPLLAGPPEAEEEAEPLPTFGLEEEEEEAEPLPTFGLEEELVPAGAGVPEDEPVLAASDFGEPDHGDREGREYVEEGEELPTLEVSLDEISLEPAEAEEAREAAFEEAVSEERAAPAAPDAPAAPWAAPVDPRAARPAAPPPAAPPADHQEAAERGDLDLAIAMVRDLLTRVPNEVEHYQRLVEYAFRKADSALLIEAYLALAGCLARTSAAAKARAVFQQVLAMDPDNAAAQDGLAVLDGAPTGPALARVASSEEYVDLGAMILGEEPEKTTRWRVAAEGPSGDEGADFAKMLSQFKQKVSEHLAVDDVAAHHDLGTAYMEMGLLDEAIGEFQLALRTAPGHLPTHEVMGRCWLEAGKPDMAARALSRALEVEFEVEDELIGIYYLMGRAQEQLGNPADAVEFYDRVFALDINFEDVTERLRALR